MKKGSKNQFIPIKVDKVNPNSDIATFLEPTFASYLNIVIKDILDNLILADITEQNWFYNAIYDSGVYKVLTIFNIQRDQLAIVKALVNYDYSPTRVNLVKFFDDLVGDGNYTLEEQIGIVNININTIPEIEDNLVTNDPTGVNNLVTNDPTGVNNLVEFLSQKLVLNAQLNFLYDTYVASGIELNIVINS